MAVPSRGGRGRGQTSGWGWPRFLCVGGWVYGDDVRTVRLIDAGGRTVEDAVEGGVVLLLSNDPVTMPCRIELRDPEDRLLRTQPRPPDSGRPNR